MSVSFSECSAASAGMRLGVRMSVGMSVTITMSVAVRLATSVCTDRRTFVSHRAGASMVVRVSALV